ncbi:bifunctional diaminohydroxyphosphoribosylaminopyrimidine deaminase/5-amino-6-(5-phosphoribosylamino)uracil reductase RibD [Rhizobium sp. TRM96647]|uniref:bifunctional diaminohydroxyphosphoribosylaminopyrimidine deaminase/5-amino-6-(5-phosphoribosylamino)uracil reductase RibD n=1 Tax=unclassified Rhizobium TaxID=2613769 RepID=UPI0021E93BFF|nr:MULTISPECIES: bifunctional diaminohydroxyphosphoribosylaminopyrimidine deaminase/5-amino-6-(5-phosphoribosylamino)uracil reductase RibD [unclassified Rhizobium]MCV3738201.1 bifunctional diaminohydroxyphosphoribosylaminopyrimidine deaminase/5-amino-6-(5-phosphoribosylamino)uracil reductase RibD [Rhizobium sp. TRM96647]MCV3760050.1 bifunctional diaminohydroxyphosphoribosylaminopyrimidine deaminase/5-amino-6-(5-phosphoribosylamino)uracil reductase RibD [Rhizobium sp. TRM96650]
MADAAEDQRFMAAAIRLSLRNLGRTGTNPSVGCVLVKDGRVLATGVTDIGGRPHAERMALGEAGEAARGATAYVTLEPCSHHGRTPPCADALIEAGVARVVVAVRDPDERVSGRGIAMLEAAGIAVETGVLAEDGRRALAAYLMRQVKKRPYVTLKLAVSPDGMIGRLGAGQLVVTGPVARGQVQVLRAASDAILIGVGTAEADDPELTCRLPGLGDRSPIRIVLDRDLRLPPYGKLALTANTVPVMAIATEPPRFDEAEDQAFLARRSVLDEAGVEVVQCDPHKLPVLLAALASRGIASLLVEGGASVASSFLSAGLVDRIHLYAGAVPIGEGGIRSPLVPGTAPAGFSLVRTLRFGPDLLEEYERDWSCSLES